MISYPPETIPTYSASPTYCKSNHSLYQSAFHIPQYIPAQNILALKAHAFYSIDSSIFSPILNTKITA